MDMYNKVVSQKELFEDKFMQAIKEKEEQTVFYKIENENKAKANQEEFASLKTEHDE